MIHLRTLSELFSFFFWCLHRVAAASGLLPILIASTVSFFPSDSIRSHSVWRRPILPKRIPRTDTTQ